MFLLIQPPRILNVLAPDEVSGLFAWWDASESSSVTSSGSPPRVSALNDLSGNGYHFAQATSGNRPRYDASINGLPAIQFDGTTQSMQESSTTDWKFLSDGSAHTVLIIAAASTPSGTTTMLGNYNNSNSVGARFTKSSTGNVGWQVGRGAAPVAASLSGGPLPDVVSLAGFRNSSPGANVLGIYVNGSQTVSSGYTEAVSSSDPTVALTLGNRGNADQGEPLIIGEVAVYDRALTDSEMSAVSRGLMRKWGVV